MVSAHASFSTHGSKLQPPLSIQTISSRPQEFRHECSLERKKKLEN